MLWLLAVPGTLNCHDILDSVAPCRPFNIFASFMMVHTIGLWCNLSKYRFNFNFPYHIFLVWNSSVLVNILTCLDEFEWNFWSQWSKSVMDNFFRKFRSIESTEDSSKTFNGMFLRFPDQTCHAVWVSNLARALNGSPTFDHTELPTALFSLTSN